MKLYFTFIGLMLLLLLPTSIVVAQDKPDASNKDAVSDADEFLKNPLTKEEGRKIFESFSDEKKKEIIKRWEELKKLPEEQRKKALENFYRLLNAEFKKQIDDVKTDIKKTKDIPPEIILANILHVAYFNVNMGRRLKHMRLMRSIQRDDPYFFYKLNSLTQEEQIKMLLKKRDELFEKKIDEIGKNIALDETKIKQLKLLLKKQRNEEDKIEGKFFEKQVEIWDKTYLKIKDNKNLFEPLVQLLHIFEAMIIRPFCNKNTKLPKSENTPQDKNSEGFRNFMKPYNPKIWKLTVDKMKLSKEKTRKLIDGYKFIFEKYEKINEFQKHREPYRKEINTLLKGILTKVEIKMLIKNINEEILREYKGRNRKGFRNE
ncbi:MAG: DUF3106 domain-containing protein [Planctomycetes bacterium]|nr:DUF3106 domain-containing protein [Planctomycetota bacterium]